MFLLLLLFFSYFSFCGQFSVDGWDHYNCDHYTSKWWKNSQRARVWSLHGGSSPLPMISLSSHGPSDGSTGFYFSLCLVLRKTQLNLELHQHRFFFSKHSILSRLHVSKNWNLMWTRTCVLKSLSNKRLMNAGSGSQENQHYHDEDTFLKVIDLKSVNCVI